MSTYKRNNIYWASIPVRVGGRHERLLLSTGTRAKGAAQRFEQKLQQLHDHAVSGIPLPADLNRFVAGLTQKQLTKLIQSGLVPNSLAMMSTPTDQHLDDFLSDCRSAGESDTHINIKRSDISKAIHAVGAERLADLNPDRLRPYFIELEEAQSARSRNRIRSALKVFMDWAVSQGRLHEHKLKTLPIACERKDVRRARRAFTNSELQALLDSTPRHRAMVYLFIARTGLRRNEVKNVTWGDIDLKAGVWELTPDETKNGKHARLPLHPQLIEELKTLAGDGVCPSQPVFPTIPRAKTVKRDIERAGLAVRDEQGRQLDLHALRTTFSTDLLRFATASQAKHATRHQQTRILEEHYNRLHDDDTRRMIGRLPSLRLVADEQGTTPSTEAQTVAPIVAHDMSEAALISMRWLDEPTKALVAHLACKIALDRYNTSSCTDRPHGAPINIQDVCKLIDGKDLGAIGAVG